MTDKKDLRPWSETKEIGLARLKKSWEKNNRKSIPKKDMEKLENWYKDKILPAVYEGKK